MALTLYVASPIFTPYQRNFHAHNVARLRREGFVCLDPHESGAIRTFERDTSTPIMPIDVFDSDYEKIAEADAMVVLLDGPDISSGLACKVGLFWVMMQRDPTKKGVLGLRTDERASQRASVGVPAINAFSLGCILDIGCVYCSQDQVVDHLHAWEKGLDTSVGGIFF